MGIRYLDDKQSTSGKVKYIDDIDFTQKQSAKDILKRPGEDLVKATLGGAAAFGAYRGLKSNLVKKIPTALSANYGRGNRADAFGNKVNEAFVKTHTEAVNRFGSDLDKWTAKYPERSVDLSELVDEIRKDPDISKQAVRIFRKTPKLGNLIDNPNAVASISLRDAQDIINHLQGKIKSGGFDVQETINNIRGSQLESFPEMAETRANYQEFIEPYKAVKNNFRTGKVLRAIENKFGDPQINVRVGKILPKDIMDEINAYRVAVKMMNPIKAGARAVLGGAGKFLGVAPMAFQAWSNAKALEEAKKTGMYKIGVNGEIIPISKEDLAI
jgi:hypothetical protein